MLNSYIWSGTNYISGDDSLFHVANISAMLDAIDLSQGRLFPSVILPTIANNLGYGVGIFYPRLPHLVATFFSLFIVFSSSECVISYSQPILYAALPYSMALTDTCLTGS